MSSDYIFRVEVFSLSPGFYLTRIGKAIYDAKMALSARQYWELKASVSQVGRHKASCYHVSYTNC
ncbi:MAG: hypothetical protein KAT23_04280, partial [Anaerolineales bacterium]|nr:hypothetical protein [Anaerolineales bacterium]